MDDIELSALLDDIRAQNEQELALFDAGMRDALQADRLALESVLEQDRELIALLEDINQQESKRLEPILSKRSTFSQQNL